jgi:hypothetical protein
MIHAMPLKVFSNTNSYLPVPRPGQVSQLERSGILAVARGRVNSFPEERTLPQIITKLEKAASILEISLPDQVFRRMSPVLAACVPF